MAATLISLRKQRKCASPSRHAVIPIQLLSTTANTVHSQSIQNRHHFRHTTNKRKVSHTLTFHPHNTSVKNIILKNFNLYQHDPTTAEIFSQPLLISYKWDTDLTKSTLKSDHQPGTFKYTRVRCPTRTKFPELSEPLPSPITSRAFPPMSSSVLPVPYAKKLYIGETGRRLGDRFREPLRGVEINDKDTSKQFARHFNQPNHSQKQMAVCGLSL